MNSKAFLVPLAIATIVLYVLAIAVLFLVKKPMPDAVWVLIPLYGVVTYFLYQMIASSSAKSPHRFVASVNGSVLIKLFMSAIIVGGYFYLKLPGKKALALAVMGIYAIYTTVLVRELLPVLRKGKP
ncbi:MAG: hypothetical protein ACK478_01960 [Flavobacteriales bacterium]|jgi:hypothetical protein